MVEVAGEPFIRHQLRLLAGEGIREVVICTGHLGDQIEAFVGGGRQFGCNVRYSRDGRKALGTGGALRQALSLLGRKFFVMYGDSYLPTRFAPIYETFCRAGLPAVMTVFRNEGRFERSNADFVNGVVTRYDKVNSPDSMKYIDYGLGIFEREVLIDYPENEAFELAEVYGKLAAMGRLAGYEVYDRFYEIGSPAGLAETGIFLKSRIVSSRN
jgi:NDP-sugar pyrophosphorylase family protein